MRLFLAWMALGVALMASCAAKAAPLNETAEYELYWAFAACDDGNLTKYQDRRAKAVKADPSITSFTGKVKSTYSVPEYLKKCDVDLPKRVAEQERRERAEREISRARDVCDHAKKEGTEAELAKYKAAKEKANAIDPAMVKASTALTECDKAIPAAIEAENKRQADHKKKLEDLAREHKEAEKKAQEEEAKHLAAMKKVLKGDRWRIWQQHGDPWDFPGEKIQAAAYWDYERTPENTSFTCTVRYAFSGNKLVRKTKSGTGCIYVD
jgi:hypothetical protein